jgi:hypothetical protein
VDSQLEGYVDQLVSIRQQVPGLVAHLTDAQFKWRPDPRRWSMAHCFDHLNTSARVFVPAIDGTIERARARGLTGSGPFAYPMLDRLFIAFNEPPPRLRVPAPRVLVPAPAASMSEIIAEFMDWQDRLRDRIRLAEGLDLRRARGRSPALPLVAWSLGGLFAITLAHERRHLWQARQVRNAAGFGG